MIYTPRDYDPFTFDPQPRLPRRHRFDFQLIALLTASAIVAGLAIVGFAAIIAWGLSQ